MKATLTTAAIVALPVAAILALLSVAGAFVYGGIVLVPAVKDTLSSWALAGRNAAAVIGTPSGDGQAQSVAQTLGEASRTLVAFRDVPQRITDESQRWRAMANRQANAARKDAAPVLAKASEVLDVASQSLAGLTLDADRTMAAGQRLMTDVQASADDLYWDAKAALETAAVGARSGAETVAAVEKEAPATLAAIRGTAQNINEATKPKKWYMRLLGVVLGIGKGIF